MKEDTNTVKNLFKFDVQTMKATRSSCCLASQVELSATLHTDYETTTKKTPTSSQEIRAIINNILNISMFGSTLLLFLKTNIHKLPQHLNGSFEKNISRKRRILLKLFYQD